MSFCYIVKRVVELVKYYIDTSVWRDYFEDRSDGLKPLGEFAFQFLKKCTEKKDILLVSDIVKKELYNHLPKETVKEIFVSFEDIIVEIKPSKAQASEARSFLIQTNKKFPFADILHSILARDNDAILITRDAHFEKIGIAKWKFPENID